MAENKEENSEAVRYCHYQIYQEDSMDGYFSCFQFQKGEDEKGIPLYGKCPFLKKDIFRDNGTERIGIRTKDGRSLFYCEQFLSTKRPPYLGNSHYHPPKKSLIDKLFNGIERAGANLLRFLGYRV